MSQTRTTTRREAVSGCPSLAKPSRGVMTNQVGSFAPNGRRKALGRSNPLPLHDAR